MGRTTDLRHSWSPDHHHWCTRLMAGQLRPALGNGEVRSLVSSARRPTALRCLILPCGGSFSASRCAPRPLRRPRGRRSARRNRPPCNARRARSSRHWTVPCPKVQSRVLPELRKRRGRHPLGSERLRGADRQSGDGSRERLSHVRCSRLRQRPDQRHRPGLSRNIQERTMWRSHAFQCDRPRSERKDPCPAPPRRPPQGTASPHSRNAPRLARSDYCFFWMNLRRTR